MSFNGYTFTGTDVLVQSSDLTASPWVNSGVTTTSVGGGAYSVTVSTTGGSRVLVGNNRTVANVDYYGFVWLKAGTVSTCEVGLLNTTFNATAASILVGPGAVVVAVARADVSGLSTTAWTLLRFTHTANGASSLADFVIYPNQTSSQTGGNSIIVAEPKLARTDDAGVGWAQTTAPSKGKLSGIIGRPLRGRI